MEDTNPCITIRPNSPLAVFYIQDLPIWRELIFCSKQKWKTMSVTGGTGDIPFMDKMLADFR
jgi:hypothetical protein